MPWLYRLPDRTLAWIIEEDPARVQARQLNQQLEQQTAAGAGRQRPRL